MPISFVMVPLLWLVPCTAIIIVLIAFLFRRKILAIQSGNDEMQQLQQLIRSGVKSFIRRLASPLFFLIGIITLLFGTCYYFFDVGVSGGLFIATYFIGIGIGVLLMYLGLQLSIRANLHTIHSANLSFEDAFKVSVRAAAVIGLISNGICVIVLWFFFWYYESPMVLIGFCFGGATIALFFRISGNLYFKSTDMAADWVAKMEYTFAQVDSRNPITIAHNIGEILEGIAGKSADLLNKYILCNFVSIALAFTLPNHDGYQQSDMIITGSFTLFTLTAGILASLISIVIIQNLVHKFPNRALDLGIFTAAGCFIGINAIFTALLISSSPFTDPSQIINGAFGLDSRLWINWLCTSLGVIAAIGIGGITKYLTNDGSFPSQATARASQKGHAMNIFVGLTYNLISLTTPIIVSLFVITIGWLLDSTLGIGNVALGMVSIVGILICNYSYAPITDNANSIAVQLKSDAKITENTHRLQSVSKSTKMITKGYAVVLAITLSCAILQLYESWVMEYISPTFEITLVDFPIVLSLILGGLVPAYFSGFLLRSLDKEMWKVVDEVRRQMVEKPAILDGKVKPAYDLIVQLVTQVVKRDLIFLFCFTLICPILVSLIFGAAGLAAFLIGIILCGAIFSFFLSHLGGMWSSVKHYIETEHEGGKGSLAHAASLTGDEVGRPLKDSAGPLLSLLLVVMSFLVLACLVFLQPLNGKGLFFFLV